MCQKFIQVSCYRLVNHTSAIWSNYYKFWAIIYIGIIEIFVLIINKLLHAEIEN